MRARDPALALLLAVAAAGCSAADPPSSGEQGADGELLALLRHRFSSGNHERDASGRYSLAMADLDADGVPEALVYVSGERWCGSGGCHLIVLDREGRSWREVTSLTITWPPIRLLETRTNGWRDIGVSVSGGGIRPRYEALLRFDGRSYPSNPSVSPAQPAPPRARGEILIPRDAESLPLFR